GGGRWGQTGRPQGRPVVTPTGRKAGSLGPANGAADVSAGRVGPPPPRVSVNRLLITPCCRFVNRTGQIGEWAVDGGGRGAAPVFILARRQGPWPVSLPTLDLRDRRLRALLSGLEAACL